MPKLLVYALILLAIAALIPPAIIARTRAVQSPNRRIHLNLDMDLQGKLLPQDPSREFADGRAMRPPVAGTIAREDFGLQADEHFYRGVVRGANGEAAWANAFPASIRVDEQFIRHGQGRFNIYCRPCHGYGGYGDGIINVRAQSLLATGKDGTTWVAPKSIHDPTVRDQPLGQVFNSITNGVRTMAGYGSQVPVADRWAIVAYVEALQLSQNASIEDVPVDAREDLPRVDARDNSRAGARAAAASRSRETSTEESSS